MKPFEISFLILKSISLSRTFAFCRERLLMISWVTPIWARICLPQTWRNRERETSTRSRVRSGGKQRGLTPFHDDKIRSHITHDMVTTFQFTYLHLLEATTDKKRGKITILFELKWDKAPLWKSSFASVGFLQNPLSLFLTFLNKYNSFHCRLEKWNSHRTNDRFFGQRKAKAFVKSSVYFADRLMTSKRSRSLFFTAWKTSFRPPTTLEQMSRAKT